MKQFTDLDTLFNQARNSEPYLSNQRFGNRVLTLINLQDPVPFWKEATIEMLGAFIGCALAYSFFPFTDLVNSIPTQFSIGPMVLLSVAGGFSLLCGIGYWTAERGQL